MLFIIYSFLENYIHVYKIKNLKNLSIKTFAKL